MTRNEYPTKTIYSSAELEAQLAELVKQGYAKSHSEAIRKAVAETIATTTPVHPEKVEQ